MKKSLRAPEETSLEDELANLLYTQHERGGQLRSQVREKSSAP